MEQKAFSITRIIMFREQKRIIAVLRSQKYAFITKRNVLLMHQCIILNSFNSIFQIIFDFSSTIDPELTDSLNEMGIAVRVNGESSDNEKHEIEEVYKLNLDVTTLMAYVSAQTNGSYNWEFVEPLLTEQAVKESKHHVKKYLEEMFEGKST